MLDLGRLELPLDPVIEPDSSLYFELDDDLTLILVRPLNKSRAALDSAVTDLEELARRETQEHPDIQYGVTGEPAVVVDLVRAVKADLRRGLFFGSPFLLLLLVWGLRSFGRALWLVVNLVLSGGWSLFPVKSCGRLTTWTVSSLRFARSTPK